MCVHVRTAVCVSAFPCVPFFFLFGSRLILLPQALISSWFSILPKTRCIITVFQPSISGPWPFVGLSGTRSLLLPVPFWGPRVCSQGHWVCILAPSLSSCDTWGPVLEPHFSHLKSGENENPTSLSIKRKSVFKLPSAWVFNGCLFCATLLLNAYYGL